MSKVKRKWDLLPEGRRRACAEEIITFFEKERDEEIGVIAAEEILDFFLQNVGNHIYNKGIEDSRGTFNKKFIDAEIDLDLLIKK